MANTDGLRSGWISVAARMQQVACTNNANAVITMNVLVDRHGNPALWFEPSVSKIETAARLDDALQQMLNAKRNVL